MKQKFYILVTLLLGLSSVLHGKNSLPLIHIKDTHTVGVQVGTGWGNSVTLGINYQYYFHRHWSFTTQIAYEIGTFAPSHFQCIGLNPGIEAAVWQPLPWLYIHLNFQVLVGYEFWDNPAIEAHTQAWNLGCSLGGNLDFYVLPQLSITLSAQEGWKYSFFPEQGENAFFPLFSLGIRYCIL